MSSHTPPDFSGEKHTQLQDAITARDARPNILMIMVDQLYYPQKGYGSAGFADEVKQILSFVGSIEGNSYAKHFPGFCKLREYAVSFTDHTIAESACIPSRASIMTGQYGPRTGVTQTDGLFKNGDAQNFPWLRADGMPTAGDYFRELGYSTHYFGKWHVSEPPEHTLQGFGFSDWELSWPEPHGASINNLGAYRDYQFADLACNFLRNRGLGVPYNRALSQRAVDFPLLTQPPQTPPFFAVCSFTNPHDIATYPALPRGLVLGTHQPAFGPGASVPIPLPGSLSNAPTEGSFQIPLNPTGLPQNCATASPTQEENLLNNNKPFAQFDYSYKVALGLAAKTGLAVAQGLGGDPATVLQNAIKATLASAIPFQLQADASAGAVGFLQYYAYMISMVDRHILRVLQTLEESGLRENTVVVFTSDHGEYGAAHGMQIEKWHGAYQEALHVPLLVSARKYNSATDAPVPVVAQTSHIDILPTLLGLAGAEPEQIERARRNLSKTHPAAAFPGADLTPLLDPLTRPETGPVKGPVIGPDGAARNGVLFATDDMITEPLPRDDDPHNVASWQQYAVYAATVELLRTPPAADAPTRPYVPDLAPGPVKQPAHVRALRSGVWKLVRYCDPWSARPAPDQWELYNLHDDPTEYCNLLVYNAVFPTVIAESSLPVGLSHEQVVAAAQQLREELARQEALLLSPYPSAYPTAMT
jgi:arylsulfatase A-like enzyme